MARVYTDRRGRTCIDTTGIPPDVVEIMRRAQGATDEAEYWNRVAIGLVELVNEMREANDCLLVALRVLSDTNAYLQAVLAGR